MIKIFMILILFCSCATTKPVETPEDNRECYKLAMVYYKEMENIILGGFTDKEKDIIKSDLVNSLCSKDNQKVSH